MNLVKPAPGFLAGLRSLCDRHGAVLIFDEVMTGFRVHERGVQGLTGITPDLTTLGKVIGGGMPVGAFGGRRAIMEKIAPLGPVYQAGTLSGNPVAVAAGLATLALTEAPDFYETLARKTRAMTDGLAAAAKRAGVTFCADAVGGMFGLYFAARVPSSYAEVMACDKERFNRFFHAMLDAGIYLAPSAYEAGFVSSAHGDAEIAATIEAAERAFAIASDEKGVRDVQCLTKRPRCTFFIGMIPGGRLGAARRRPPVNGTKQRASCAMQGLTPLDRVRGDARFSRPAADPSRTRPARRRRDARGTQARRGNRAHRTRMDAAVFRVERGRRAGASHVRMARGARRCPLGRCRGTPSSACAAAGESACVRRHAGLAQRARPHRQQGRGGLVCALRCASVPRRSDRAPPAARDRAAPRRQRPHDRAAFTAARVTDRTEAARLAAHGAGARPGRRARHPESGARSVRHAVGATGEGRSCDRTAARHASVRTARGRREAACAACHP